MDVVTRTTRNVIFLVFRPTGHPPSRRRSGPAGTTSVTGRSDTIRYDTIRSVRPGEPSDRHPTRPGRRLWVAGFGLRVCRRAGEREPTNRRPRCARDNQGPAHSPEAVRPVLPGDAGFFRQVSALSARTVPTSSSSMPVTTSAQSPTSLHVPFEADQPVRGRIPAPRQEEPPIQAEPRGRHPMIVLERADRPARDDIHSRAHVPSADQDRLTVRVEGHGRAQVSGDVLSAGFPVVVSHQPHSRLDAVPPPVRNVPPSELKATPDDAPPLGL